MAASGARDRRADQRARDRPLAGPRWPGPRGGLRRGDDLTRKSPGDSAGRARRVGPWARPRPVDAGHRPRLGPRRLRGTQGQERCAGQRGDGDVGSRELRCARYGVRIAGDQRGHPDRSRGARWPHAPLDPAAGIAGRGDRLPRLSGLGIPHGAEYIGVRDHPARASAHAPADGGRLLLDVGRRDACRRRHVRDRLGRSEGRGACRAQAVPPAANRGSDRRRTRHHIRATRRSDPLRRALLRLARAGSSRPAGGDAVRSPRSACSSRAKGSRGPCRWAASAAVQCSRQSS